MIVKPKSTGFSCIYTVSKKVIFEISIQKYNKQTEDFEGAQQTIDFLMNYTIKSELDGRSKNHVGSECHASLGEINSRLLKCEYTKRIQ